MAYCRFRGQALLNRTGTRQRLTGPRQGIPNSAIPGGEKPQRTNCERETKTQPKPKRSP